MKRRNSFSWKRLLGSPVTLVIALVIFGVMARAAWNMVSRDRASALRLQQAQAQYAKLSDSQAALSGEVSELSSPDGVEADLKEKYHAVAPGESVAVIVDNSDPDDPDAGLSAPAGQASTTAPTGNWWDRIVSFFGL